MTRRQTILLTLMAAGLAAGTIVWCSSEPTYQNRPLTDWLQQYEDATIPGPAFTRHITKPEQASMAMQAIQEIGPRAVPFLVKWISLEKPWWQRAMAKAQPHLPIPLRQHLRPILNDKTANKINHAQTGFLILGPAAAGAIPELRMTMTKSPSIKQRLRLVSALMAIGPKAAPDLAWVYVTDYHRVKNQNEFRDFALLGELPSQVDLLLRREFAKFGTNTTPLVRVIIPYLKQQTNLEMQCKALQLLACVRQQPEICISILSNSLDTQDLRRQIIALGGLANFGPAAREAVPKIAGLSQIGDPELHKWVTNALMAIAPETMTNADAELTR